MFGQPFSGNHDLLECVAELAAASKGLTVIFRKQYYDPRCIQVQTQSMVTNLFYEIVDTYCNYFTAPVKATCVIINPRIGGHFAIDHPWFCFSDTGRAWFLAGIRSASGNICSL